MTIYSPGLRKLSRGEDTAIIDKISNFVESIQLNKSSNSKATTTKSSAAGSSTLTTNGVERSDGDNPNTVADQLLIQSEKFRARVEAPKGKNPYFNMLMPYDYEKLRSKFVKPEGLAPLDSEILFLRNFDQDDEFFHVTSQIDPGLRSKIERGEFIDLERLLPHDRTLGRPSMGSEDLNKQLFQLISQGTNNYLEPPVPKTGKINSIRKWDQAF